MFITALLVLEWEAKWLKRNTGAWPSVEGNEHAYMVLLGGAVLQTSLIGMMPYATIIQAGGIVEDYVWLRTAPQHKIKGFRVFEKGKPVRADRMSRAKIRSGAYQIKPYGWAATRSGGRRLIAAKIAARFIPYLGWGLLAYDAYLVGKWVHGKTRWGNPTPGPTP